MKKPIRAEKKTRRKKEGPSVDKSFKLATGDAMPIDHFQKSIPVYEVREMHQVDRDGSDELLSRARMQWQFGDWDSLCKIDLLHIEHHPECAELALLVGCAFLQSGESRERSKDYLAAAANWGGDKARMLQLLVSGVHNTLGAYNLLIGNEQKALSLFGAGAVGQGGDVKLIVESRYRREVEKLGLKDARNLTLKEEHRAETAQMLPVLDHNPVMDRFMGENFSMQKAVETASTSESVFKLGIVSYAQNFEDVMLWRALKDVERGFYIDIGAQHPVSDSVSKAFYEKGWRGIHVEATQRYANLLREDRPDESVIQAAVSDQCGKITFYEIPETGMSTGDANIAAMHRGNGYPVKETTVTTITLADVFAMAGKREIHWMKIDVEGMERAVLQGWGNCPQRPWIVVVESTVPNSTIKTNAHWEEYLTQRGYSFVYFDGLSSFYVFNEKKLQKYFLVPPNIFDNFSVKRSFI